AGVDRVVGMFINTLPVRIVLGEEPVESSVRRTHAQLAELLRHEHAPLALAQASSGIPAQAPLFSSLLNYRHSADVRQAPSTDVLQVMDGIEAVYRGEERTNYPCTLSVDDLGKEFLLTAKVDSRVEPERICEMMHTAMERLVEALEVEPARSARSLDVMPEAERRRLLVEWNASAAACPPQQCLHELFQAHAERTPEAIAVVQEDRQLSYGELNARANRLAHYLRELGVGPGTRVVLYLERSPEIVLALLAVLKAGGAYVPLDPGYPDERLRYMLRDSAPQVLLTETTVGPLL